MKVEVAQLCLTLCEHMDYTVHGIYLARILKWVAFPFSRGSSQPRDRTQVFHITGRFFTSWATREAHLVHCCIPNYSNSASSINTGWKYECSPSWVEHICFPLLFRGWTVSFHCLLLTYLPLSISTPFGVHFGIYLAFSVLCWPFWFSLVILCHWCLEREHT